MIDCWDYEKYGHLILNKISQLQFPTFSLPVLFFPPRRLNIHLAFWAFTTRWLHYTLL